METDQPILTIAIPTYNRAAKLRAQLDQLTPQLTREVRIRVYDNASPDDTQEVATKYSGISYFRSSTNCGAGRNIFRAFEECQTEWLWVLCDDDLATTNAVADLLTLLRGEPCDFVHTYSWICPYSKATLVSDLPSLFEHSNLSCLLWMTAGIYRVNSFRPFFRIYNEAIFTWGPHLVIVLCLLASGKGTARLSPVRLTLPTTGPMAWSTLNCLLRLSMVPEFLANLSDQQLVAERVYLDFFCFLMLPGLRETASRQQIRRWQRIRAQVEKNLKTYQARGLGSHVARNWYRAGRRKESLRIAMETIEIKLLSWCPVSLFNALIKLLPLPKHLREDYIAKRKEFVPYA